MKIRLPLIFMAIGMLLVFQAGSADARSYYSERFDVQIDVQKGGSFVVTETVMFYFEGGPYTYAFRDIALRELDQLEILEASMDGKVLPEGIEPGQVEIRRNRDLYQVTWHFLPTSDALRTFTLTYRVEGNIRRADGLDGLSWRAVPEEHEYEIRASRITINYPPELSPSGDPALDGAPFSLEQAPGQIEFQVLNIPRDTPLIVDVHFPQGSLISQPPAWQSRQVERTRESGAALPYALAAGGGIFAVILAGLGVFLRKNRLEFPQTIQPGIVTSPPDDLTPAQAGYLLNRISPTLNHIFAGLLDLTRRGWLRMQEVQGRGLFKTKDFVITRERSNGSLQTHEAALIDLLFKTRRGCREQVKLSEIGARLSSRLSGYAKELRSELTSQGLILSERVQQRSRLAGLGFALIFLGLVLALIGVISIGIVDSGMVFGGTVLLGLGIGLSTAAFAVWAQSSSWQVLSETGAVRLERWTSYRAYLKDLIQSDAALREEWLNEYLPYAVAFGLGERWVDAFKKRGLSTALPWVLSASGGHADGVVVAASISASSASGSGAGGGGGGGASGAG